MIVLVNGNNCVIVLIGIQKTLIFGKKEIVSSKCLIKKPYAEKLK